MTQTNAPRYDLLAPLVLWIAICDQRREYRVTFEPGPGQDARVVEFLKARSVGGARYGREGYAYGNHAWGLDDQDADEGTLRVDLAAWPLTEAFLFPECEHGLLATNCFGPDHYMSRAQEMERGW